MPTSREPPSTPLLLIGTASITGYALAQAEPRRVVPVCTPFHRSRDLPRLRIVRLESTGEIEMLFEEFKTPSPTVIYAHAVCDVPACENAPDWAHEVNVGNLERVLSVAPPSVRFVYLSSDHVFGGAGRYRENDLPSPISVYGETRQRAEKLLRNRSDMLIVRVGLPIGPSPDGRTGHRDWLEYRTGKGLPVTIIRDEIRSVYPAEDAARRILELVDQGITGVRHLVSREPLTRPELATRLLRRLGRKANFVLKSAADLPNPHPRRLILDTRFKDRLAEPLPGIAAHDEPSPR